jgi:hypothetical protein
LWINGLGAHPTAPRGTIYPQTTLTSWLQKNVKSDERVLFLTPRGTWAPTEGLQQARGIAHPPGVLPPNGATVYGLNDVSGYDSLAPLAYREFVNTGEGENVSPPLNGNMILINNVQSPALVALNVRYVVALETQELPLDNKVFSADGSAVYQLPLANVMRKNGADFYPGWKDGKYQPETFRLGTFVALCALALVAWALVAGLGWRVGRAESV